MIVLTHPAFVWTRPRREGFQYSLKNWGTDIPRNSESPVIMRFLIEFMFVNWRNDNPTEAENQETELLCSDKKRKEKRRSRKLNSLIANDIPTRPKRTQYNAANIGKGIDANTAPNFPAKIAKYLLLLKEMEETKNVTTKASIPVCEQISGKGFFITWHVITILKTNPLCTTRIKKANKKGGALLFKHAQTALSKNIIPT